MQNCCNIKLVFNEQKHIISVTFQRYLQLLNYFPEKIGMKQYHHQYYNIESIVSEETFDNFKKYLTDSLEPEINSYNLHEYYLLSQEFQVLTDYLSDKMDESIINLSILISSMNRDKSRSEKYVSMHLTDFIDKYDQELKKIPINSLFNIFYHPERVLSDHQKAYDFITKECTNSSLYILLESLDGELLNQKSKFESFLKSQERLGFHPKFNQSFFDSIEEKVNQYESIINENKEIKEKIQIMKNSQFEYQGNGKERFNGIIRYLTEKCGGNVHEKRLVNVTGKNYIPEWKWGEKYRYPKYVVDLDTDKYFDSSFDPNNRDEIMYLEYDFIDRRVCPTDYSIRSRPDGKKGFANLLSWIIEGRNKEDENWILLDKRENDETIDGPLLQNTFKIRLNKEFLFFRFLRIGCINNGHNDHALVLSALEFFGSLLENK